MSYFQIWQASFHIWVISSVNTRGQQCATEMKCIGKPICLTKLIHKRYFFKYLGTIQVFGQNVIHITWNNDQNIKLVKQLITDIRSFFPKWDNTVLPPIANQVHPWTFIGNQHILSISVQLDYWRTDLQIQKGSN